MNFTEYGANGERDSRWWGESGLRAGFAGGLGGFNLLFVVAFAAFVMFGCGGELSVQGFDMGFACADGLFVFA